MSVQKLREFINRHSPSAGALAGLATLLDAHTSGTPLDPVLAVHVQELLGALGATGILDNLSVQEAKPFLAELRLMAGIEAKLLYEQTRSVGWNHFEPDILQNAGDSSAGFVQHLARVVVPGLEGLSQRLNAPGSAFLDVGVGVARLAITVVQKWPELRVVGIDSWQPSLALARKNVQEAGLEDRIQVRKQGVEDLEDEEAFDLAWLPIPFIPQRVIRTGCQRIHRALRPGGWMLVSIINPDLAPPSLALWRLRTTLFGNGDLDPGDVESMLLDVSFVDVHTIQSPPDAFLGLVAARRRLA